MITVYIIDSLILKQINKKIMIVCKITRGRNANLFNNVARIFSQIKLLSTVIRIILTM